MKKPEKRVWPLRYKWHLDPDNPGAGYVNSCTVVEAPTEEEARKKLKEHHPNIEFVE